MDLPNCHNRNPLERDGTSQQQRTLKALLPSYVAVDEKDKEDLMEFARRFAEEIHFFNLDNTTNPSNTWEALFDKTERADDLNSPHYALFLTFLELFRYAQDDLNKITQKHLDFYFQRVLGLKPNNAVADQAFIIFELAKHVNDGSHRLKKGTQLKAGKDALGNNRVYELTRDIIVNRATVEEIKSLFLNANDAYTELDPYPTNAMRLYASPQADSEDGQGEDLVSEDLSWRTFGKPTFPNLPIVGPDQFQADRPQADLGFAIASPNLFLAEGERLITITLQFAENSNLDAITNADLYDAFQVMFSGEKEWIMPIWGTKRYLAEGEIDDVVVERILDFLNAAERPEDIAGIEPQEGPVYDDPALGYGDQHRDYDIGMTVAANIIADRDQLPQGFTNLQQVRDVYGIGVDKINDLAYSFSVPTHYTTLDREAKQLIIHRVITKAQPAIVAYDQEVLIDPFQTQWPVAKVLLNKEDTRNPYIYEILRGLQVTEATLTVDVRQVRDLILQNDLSVLDGGKPFQPFGNRPFVGSNFYLGSREVFQKSLRSLDIDITWSDLPDDPNGFRDYYDNYVPDIDGRLNNSFVADIGIMDGKDFIPVTPVSSENRQLFDNADNEPLQAAKSFFLEAGEGATLGSIDRDTTLAPFKKLNNETQRGFVRLALGGIDFGHKDYQVSYTKAVINALNLDPGPPTPDYTDALPKEPYTPTMEKVWLDYVAEEKISLTAVAKDDWEERIDQFFHVQPFGVGELDTRKRSHTMLPTFEAEGSLFIGLKDLKPPQNVSLLFQVSEGSADPDLLPPELSWSYMKDNEWLPFPTQSVLSDSTNGLLTTGIIQLAVPGDASSNNTVLTNGLHWIRVSVTQDASAIPRMIAIKAQVVAVEFVDQGNDPEHLAAPLPEGTIKKFVVADSAIGAINQPYTSFGGAMVEESGAFYTRVSERLRHKRRAITIWDYERIILQEFPEVYKVKCLNHTRYEGTLSNYSEAAPGHVSLIVVSNVRNRNAVNPLKPRTSLSTLTEIGALIGALRSPYIHVHVKNPIFEEVKVDFNVSFRPGYDEGFYQNVLNQAITQFLSPWAFEGGADVAFGGRVHQSVILNFVEQQEYVDYVTCFKMMHIIPGDSTNDPTQAVEEAIASTAASVLGSAASHTITLIKDAGCECDDNLVVTTELAPPDDCPCDQ